MKHTSFPTFGGDFGPPANLCNSKIYLSSVVTWCISELYPYFVISCGFMNNDNFILKIYSVKNHPCSQVIQKKR